MEFTTSLNAYSSLIHAVATVVLVLVNIYYVRQAKKSAVELEKARKFEFVPILAVRMETRDARTVDLYLSNIGRGIAQQPVVSMPFVKDSIAGEAIAPLQENVLVTIEGVGTPEILELPKEERKMVVSYGDIFGREFKTEVLLTSDRRDGEALENESLMLEDWEVIFPD